MILRWRRVSDTHWMVFHRSDTLIVEVGRHTDAIVYALKYFRIKYG